MKHFVTAENQQGKENDRKEARPRSLLRQFLKVNFPFIFTIEKNHDFGVNSKRVVSLPQKLPDLRIPFRGILFTLEDSIRRDFNSVTSFEGEKQVVGRELHPLRREDRPEMPLTSDIFHDFPPAAWSIKYLIIKHDTTRLPRRCCVYECTRIEDSASVGCLSRLRVGLKSILHPRLPPCSGCWPAESLRGLATP